MFRIIAPFFAIRTDWLAGILLFAFLSTTSDCQTYTPPSARRLDVLLDSGWRFIRQDVAGAQTNGFDDSGWTHLNLPHTWNNLDGQDGGNNYYRGVGWYRRHYTVDPSQTNRHLFLKFDGVNIVSDVYVNGTLIGEHQGGFAAFVFDATTNLIMGSDNVIAVKVNNASNTNIPPLSADFTFFGGIYRDVHLLITDPVQVSPLDYGSPGVYLTATNVSASSANLQVTAVVSNATASAASVTVRAVITDAATNIVLTLSNFASVAAGSALNVVSAGVIANPHLWNGLYDPYLYQAFIELYSGTNLVDELSQPLGFRSYIVDPNTGFYLNSRSYPIHGVCMHQDFYNLGWALDNAQRETNFSLLKELGANGIRLAHYQHADYTYQFADRNGIVVWTEVPLVNSVSSGAAFLANAQQQLRELIRQNYNHPSIICWSMFNEITLGSGPSPNSVVSNLVQLAAQEDPTRLSCGATLAGNGDATSWLPQLIGFNEYYGWYSDPITGLASWADNIHAAHPTNRFAVTEYGAGASLYQHSEDPVAKPTTTGGKFHPEEWQNLVHEANYAALKARPYIWGTFLWNMFDFAVDSRNEGDTPGRNDKGLVSYDRQSRKDAFYFYKANWSTNPMVYITGHTFTNRLTNSMTAKVYANCDSVELFVNETSQGSQTSPNCIFTWPITLGVGSNYVRAVGNKAASNVIDSLTWFAPIPPPLVSVVTPVGAVASLNSTSGVLKISVAVSNPAPANPLTTTWSQLSGPGAVTFADSNALSTTASFSGDGIYGLAFNASNGAATNVTVLVLVNTDPRITNGLAAWWKMDEAGGSTAADSSANGRNAAVVNGIFTGGYISNAIQFTTAGSQATYTAQQSNQVTVAAWVRCDTTGGGGFPRIVDTPSYRFMFRFSSSDVNSVGFATYDSVNGDFDSGAGTISVGLWYHVAATFDRSILANPPAFYINGRKMTTTTLTAPSGTPPSLSGTGYIGNNSANTRAWNGLIDDLRVYNRFLSDIEIQTLAAVPPPNSAPLVSAGINQTVICPASINLNGWVTDDGNPNPPGALDVSWTQLSGPGPVLFDNSNATNTTVTFPVPGTYRLELLASDGQAITGGDIVVQAIAQPVLQVRPSLQTLRLSWQSEVPWRLQGKSNSLNTGSWMDLAGPAATNSIIVNIDHLNQSVFYRLILQQ